MRNFTDHQAGKRCLSGFLMPAHVPVLDWSDIVVLPEDFSEIAATAKAGFQGNVQDTFLSIHKKLPGFLQAECCQVFHRGNAKAAFKQPEAFTLADGDTAGYLAHC